MSTVTFADRRFRRSDRSGLVAKHGCEIGFVAISLLVIATISAFDIWLAVANSSILIVEKNPICLALMELDPDGFSYFILAKSLGTLCVILILACLHWKRYRHAKKITSTIMIFQLGLLTYLTLSDPMMYNLPNFGLLFGEGNDSIWNIR